MAFPAKLSTTFLPSELFFLSEDTLITIIPRQSLDSINLIGFQTPKLRNLQRAQVPIWLAAILKKQSRCTIVPPEWLTEPVLKEIYQEELNNYDMFSEKLPWGWLEISQYLLDFAKDDLGSSPHTIRNLIRDIREARQAKARAGIKELNEGHLRMDNLGQMELNELRPFISMVMQEIQKLVEIGVDQNQLDQDDDPMDQDQEQYMNEEQNQGQELNSAPPRIYDEMDNEF